MRLSYSSLFPDKVKHAWCKRKRLAADNAYGLAGGDYCIYDLYALSGIADPDIYLTVEYRKDQSQSATLRCLLSPNKAAIMISAEHLQSPVAPAVRDMVEAVFKEDSALRKMLQQRKREVQVACENLRIAQDVPETQLLPELAIRRLAGTLEQVMQSDNTEDAENHLDALLVDLRQSLLNNFVQQQAQS